LELQDVNQYGKSWNILLHIPKKFLWRGLFDKTEYNELENGAAVLFEIIELETGVNIIWIEQK
jgi:hypothetical protein